MSDRAESTDTTFWASGDPRAGLQCYRTLVEMVDGCVFQLDDDGRLVAVDDALLELTGFSRETLLGDHVSTLFDVADERRIIQRIRAHTDANAEANAKANGAGEADSLTVALRTAADSPIACDLRLNGVAAVDDEHRQHQQQRHTETTAPDTEDGTETCNDTRDTDRPRSGGVIGIVRERTAEHVDADDRADRPSPEGHDTARTRTDGDATPAATQADEPPAATQADEPLVPVLEEADVGVIILDDAFDVTWINEATERYFGINRGDVLGRNKREVIADTIEERIDDHERFRETVFATYDNNTSVERFECRITAGEGRDERWLEHRSRPIESGPYAGGRVELYYDITDQRRRVHQLRQLNAAVRDWLEADTLKRVAERACRSLHEIVDLEINGIFRYDSEQEALRPLAVSEAGHQLFDELPTFDSGEGIAWRVFASGQPEIYEDVRSDPDVYNPETPIRSEIILPIGDHGILIAGSQQPDMFDDGDLSLAKIAASSLEATFDRIENERRLARERSQTEELIRTAPVAISVEDATGETILENRRAAAAAELPARRTIAEAAVSEDVGDEGDEGDDRDKRDDGDGGGETNETKGADEAETNSDTPAAWTVSDGDGNRLDADETPSARARETGEPVYDEELVFEGPDGERTWFSVNAAPVFAPDGTIERIVSVGEDITDLKQHERKLERRKHELETELSEILGRVSDAFYALDEEWRFTHVNDRAAEILQRPESELLGRRLWEVYGEDDDDLVRAKLQHAMASQERVNFETDAETLDTWLEFNVYPSETGLSVYFRDVSERKAYERKLEASNERLEQFAYAASHDLQEPLRMVSSYLQLIEDRYSGDLDEDGREFVEYAVDGADRMREMIEGLLEYSRIETQGDPLEPVALDDVLADVREDLQLQIDETDANVTAESLPRVRGDAGQLRQVFQNLLSNAIEYSGDEPPQVRIEAERDGANWRISVTDDGIGIESDDQERVFEVFQRLHSHDEHAGTGIGLALCKRIIERHGVRASDASSAGSRSESAAGEIWVDSDPGEGTTISFTLPALADRD